MSQTRTVAVVAGSLRKESISRRLAQALTALAPKSLTFKFVEIGGLPHFDQDLEADPPQAWVEFRKQILDADAVLFVTPEYNRSIPGVLKNAIDVGSRPYGQSVWNGKPGAIVSLSPGNIGGYGANNHLRQVLAVLNVPVLVQPEVYLADAFNLLDADGAVAKPQTEAFLRGVMRSFAGWIERNIDEPQIRAAA